MLLRTIDLCAGIGGIRKGFELTGAFTNVLSAEIDKMACLTYKHLYNEDAYNDLTSDEFKQKVSSIAYDVLLAGFPCQTFSKAGLEAGFKDKTKGIIFWHIADIIKATRPRAIFLENVDNLISHDNGHTFRTILDTLERVLNYKVIGTTTDMAGGIKFERRAFVRNSRFFGVPQNRKRAYIMAFDRERYDSTLLSCLENTLPEKNDLYLYDDLRDLIEPNAPAKYYMAEGYLETLEKHKIREHAKGHGFGFCIVNAENIEHPIANTILATGGSGRERNLIYDPQPGIAGQMIVGKKTPLNSKGIRVMTPREWGKLQGFINYAFIDEKGEDHFSFPEEVADVQQYKQFGNSVTIPLVETMADFMLDCFRILGDLSNG